MALPPKTPAVEKTRVQVAAGRTVYLGGSTHPFRPGDEFDVPQDEAARLIAMGNVFDPSKKPAAPASTPIVSSAETAPGPSAASATSPAPTPVTEAGGGKDA